MKKTKIAENIARLYHNSLNEQGHSSNVRKASDGHNLRNDLTKRNRLNGNTKDNILYINGQKVDPLNTEENYILVTKTCDDLKKSFQDEARKNNNDVSLSAQRKAKLQTDRAKLKAKIKKWSENEKAYPDEKEFFKKLYSDLGNEELKSNELIPKLQKMGKSVKRFNDKKKAISGVDDLNDLLGTSSTNINLSLITKELVFKIPEDNNLNIKPDDFLRITRQVKKNFYPDFDSIYETVHLDEQKPHVHIRLSGKNNNTNQFDIQNSLLNKVRAFDKQKRLPKDKKYSQLTKEETRLFGEIYQEQVFTVFNGMLKKLKYNCPVVKRTAEQKKDDWKKFKDKTNKIADREFNIQNHLAIKNKKAEKAFFETNDLVNKNTETIEDQKLEINRNKHLNKSELKKLNKTKEEVSFLEEKMEKIKQYFADGFKGAVEYALDQLPSSLKRYVENQKEIDKLKIDSGNDLHKQSISIQPNEEQKTKIKNSRRRGPGF